MHIGFLPYFSLIILYFMILPFSIQCMFILPDWSIKVKQELFTFFDDDKDFPHHLTHM